MVTTCAIVGDSIADMLVPYFKECEHSAKSGISSAKVLGRTPSGKTVVIVSAGSNDPDNPRLKDNLRAIRAKHNDRVIWIVPAVAVAREAVVAVAAEHHDDVVFFVAGHDHVHPHYLRPLAQALHAKMNQGW